MATREQEFSEVRRLLDFPKEGKPSNDLIVAANIRREQFMMNQQNGSGRGWSVNSPVQLTSIVNQAEYSLYSNDPTNTTALTGFGRALFCYRELSGSVILPVPFTDYVNEFDNQSYDLVYAPATANVYPGVSGEKLAFYRTAAGLTKVRIFPIPAEAKVYKIIYASGVLDWSTFTWSDTPFMPEWTHLRCIGSALTLIDQSEWDGLSFDQNRLKRTDRATNLQAQFSEQNGEYMPFLNNPQIGASIGTVGAWYD